MSTLITERKQIPDTPYYVLSTDTFMSGWGMSDGRDNIIILPCANRKEAEYMRLRIKRTRTDQKRVRVIACKPRLDLRLHTYSLFTPENAEAWYYTTFNIIPARDGQFYFNATLSTGAYGSHRPTLSEALAEIFRIAAWEGIRRLEIEWSYPIEPANNTPNDLSVAIV